MNYIGMTQKGSRQGRPEEPETFDGAVATCGELDQKAGRC
jgi:hypothetical protein